MKKERSFPVLSLVVICLLAYANSLNNAFLNWDDGAYVFENPHIRGLTVENIKHLLFDYYVGEWFPLQMLSYLFDYQIWELDVPGYHLTNLFFHIGSVILLYLIFQAIGYRKNESLVAGALFAIFPPSVEAISWISQRKSVMCMFFMLLSFYLYMRNLIYPSIGVFALSLLSKSTSTPFPAVIFFYETLLKGKSIGNGIKRSLPFLVLSLFFLTIFIYGQREERVIKNYGLNAIWESFIIFLISPFFGFISRLFLPVNLNPFYPPQSYGTTSRTEILLSAFLWIFVLAPVIFFSLRDKLRVFWLSYYFVIAFPVVLLVALALPASPTETSPNGGDRHLYFLYPALIGFLLAGLEEFLKSRWRIFAPLLVLLLSSYLILTIQRNYIWRGDFSLWTDAVKKTPDYFLSQLKAGEVHLSEFYKTKEEHHLKSAIMHLKRSVELNPYIAKAHYQLAEALEAQMDYEGALKHYEESMRWAKNKSPYPLQSIGRIYYRLKRYREAIDSYIKAIEIDPDSYILWNDKGGVEIEAGLYDDAINSFERSLSINYNQYDVHRKLGALYLKKRDDVRALLHFEESLKLNPAQEDITTLLKIINELGERVKR